MFTIEVSKSSVSDVSSVSSVSSVHSSSPEVSPEVSAVSVVVVVLARADVMVSVGHLVAVHVGLAVWEVAKVVADRLVKRDVL